MRSLVSGQNDDRVVASILHDLQQNLNGLLTVVTRPVWPMTMNDRRVVSKPQRRIEGHDTHGHGETLVASLHK